MDLIEILFGIFFLTVIVSSQLHHIAISALKEAPKEYERVGSPEPGFTVGIMNFKYLQYVLAGDFSRIEKRWIIEKLKRARYGQFVYFITFLGLVVIMFNLR